MGLLRTLWREARARADEDAKRPEPDGRAIENLVALMHLAWRYRSVTGPLATSGGVYLAGIALHPNTGWAMTVLLTLTGSAAGAGWAATRLASGRERRTIYTVTPLAGLWIVLARTVGPGAPPLLWAWITGTIAVTSVWAWHRRARRRLVTADPEIPRRARRKRRRHIHRTYVTPWPWIADAVGLAGAELVDVTATLYGLATRVRLAAGQDMSNLVRAIPAIESHYDLPEGSMQVERQDDRRRRYAVVHIAETDPHADAVECQGPSISDPMEPGTVGLHIDGVPKQVAMFSPKGARQGLTSGMQGSGKSGLANRLLINYAPLPDVVIILIDLKGGQEFRPWAPAAWIVATTVEQAQAVMGGIENLVTDRGGRASGRTWTTADGPMVLVMCDEAAELVGVNQALVSTVRRGRSTGVATELLTQYPTGDAVNTQVTANVNVRAAFRAASRGHARLATLDDVDPSAIPADREGTCYMETPEEAREVPCRIEWSSDKLIEQVVADTAPTPLSGQDLEAFRAGAGDKVDLVLPPRADTREDTDSSPSGDTDSGQEADGQPQGQGEGQPTGQGQADTDIDPDQYPIPTNVPMSALAVPGQEPPERPNLSTTEAEQLIEQAFDEHDIVRPRHLRKLTGKGDTFVHKRLDDLEEQGRIECVVKGEYRKATGELVNA